MLMKEHFVTIFDSLFLPQGLALQQSMERNVSNYILWILCVDNVSYDVLKKLSLPNVRLLQLSDFENDELLKVKSERTTGEYCWTLTPFSIRFVFESDESVSRVTYLDADLWFMTPPDILFKEMDASGKGVLITDHGYAPEYDQSAKSGQYCVQFMVFTRQSETVRKWWEDRCIEWCYARAENGKYGDQKYLDCWPELFPDMVHVLANKESCLAPWNATRFPYGGGVFWHFQGLRLAFFGSKLVVYYGDYVLPRCVQEFVYDSYCSDLKSAIAQLEKLGYKIKSQRKFSLLGFLKGLASGLYVLLSELHTGKIKRI